MLSQATTDHASRWTRNIRSQAGAHSAPTFPSAGRAPRCPLCHVTCWSGPAAGTRRELASGGGQRGPFSVVDGCLVPGVGLALDLERAVLHVEVLAQALAQRV